MEVCEDTNVQQQSFSEEVPAIFPSFCLICGELLNKVIKHEHEDSTVDENGQEEADISSSNIVTLIHEAAPWSEVESSLFQQFLKWFKVKLGNKIAWNNESEYFPFCAECKGQLVTLLETQQKLNEITKALKCGVQQVRNQMESCEESFGVNNIYDNDIRYYEVRRQLLKVSTKPSRYNHQRARPKRVVSEPQKQVEDGPELTKPFPVIPESTSEESRRPTRKRKSAVRYDYDLEDEDGNKKTLMSPTPVVLLSANDQINAEKHLSSELVIKVEPDENYEHLTRNNNNAKSNLCTSSEAININYAELSDNDWDDLTKDPLEMDNDIIAESKPGPSRKKSRDPKKKEQARPKKKKMHVDFVMSDNSLSAKSEDNDEIDDNMWDGRKRRKDDRVIFDEDNATFSCMDIVFDKVPGETEQYKCRKCEAILNLENRTMRNKQRAIKEHVVMVHTDRFVCKECGHRERSHGHLKKHIKFTHQGVSQYQLHKKNARPCPVCEKPLPRIHMKRHLWTHKNAEEREEAIARGEKDPTSFLRKMKYQCDQCGKDFALQSQWKQHTEFAHQTEEEKEKRKELCPECGKVTLYLKQHMLHYHNQTRKIECSVCNKEFASWARLKKHREVIHQNIRPFACTLCPRTFPQARVLEDHMKLHLNIRDWKCEQCDGAFIKKYHLAKHMKTFHVEGAKVPRRKSYQRGPTQLKIGQKKKDLVETNTYCPPSYKSWWKPKLGTADDDDEPKQEQDTKSFLSSN